jgi:putative sterol carrier protein
MATTTNYGFEKPVVGAQEDTWGDLLNGNWDDLDALLGGVSAAEFGYLDGVTGAIQTQLNAKADDTDASIATSISLTGAASDWKFSLSGDDLIISYGGTAKAKLDTSGNLTVTGDITAFGTI